MAAVNVKIIYTGPIVDAVRKGEEIARYFVPNNSYVDTPVFEQGYANEGAVGDKNSYGKSIYATNVDGWGSCPGLLPIASASVKIAEFERAALAAAAAKEAGTANEGVSFQIEGYEDELYWNQISSQIYQQGFYIEVGDNKYGDEPDSDTDTDTDSQ
ncbi:MAG: hypothetical protein IJE78_05405 [Bacteroidaceae bacterium]|nr:hypothetical protein [Bacteroidaceae bacterium]